MKVFLCFLVLAGIHAHGATIDDVDRLLELLDRHNTRALSQSPIEHVKPSLVGSGVLYPEVKPALMEMTSFQRCNFIGDYFEEFLKIPTEIDMIDMVGYRPEMLTVLMRTLESFRQIDDYEAIALVTARRIAKMIFMDRLRCRATVLERFITNVVLRELYLTVEAEGEDSMVTGLIPVLARIPHIETSAETPETLARLMARETRGHVFNDTIEVMLSSSMRDVTEVAQMIYITLRRKLPSLMTLGPIEMSTYFETFLRTNMYSVYCPSMLDAGSRHFDAIWELGHGLREVETYEICTKVNKFIQYYVPEPTVMHGDDETAYNAILQESCEVITGYIKEVEGLLEKIEREFKAGDPTSFMEMAKPYFSEEELVLLRKVMEMIEWSVPENPDDMNHAYEEGILKRWNSWARGV